MAARAKRRAAKVEPLKTTLPLSKKRMNQALRNFTNSLNARRMISSAWINTSSGGMN
jgi:hypothetical protein